VGIGKNGPGILGVKLEHHPTLKCLELQFMKKM
jgi:hypothetical protein